MNEAEKALRESVKRAKQVQGQRQEVAEVAESLRELASRPVLITAG